MGLIYIDLAEYLAAKFLSVDHYGRCSPDCLCREILAERREVRAALDLLIAQRLEQQR